MARLNVCINDRFRYGGRIMKVSQIGIEARTLKGLYICGSGRTMARARKVRVLNGEAPERLFTIRMVSKAIRKFKREVANGDTQ